MRKIIILASLVSMAIWADAQVISPVLWSYSAQKTGDKTYEIHITATIQNTWHLYSQIQPSDAIVMPTEIKFKSNPLVTLDGKIKEVGKMEAYHDKQLKISANQYSDKVDFVQKIKLKTSSKTSIVGSVQFQTCDDKKCLPAKKIDFSIAL